MQHPDDGSPGIPLLTQGQTRGICCHLPVKPEARRRNELFGNRRSFYGSSLESFYMKSLWCLQKPPTCVSMLLTKSTVNLITGWPVYLLVFQNGKRCYLQRYILKCSATGGASLFDKLGLRICCKSCCRLQPIMML